MFLFCKVAADTEASHVIIHIFHQKFFRLPQGKKPENWKSTLMFNQNSKTCKLHTLNPNSCNFVIDSNE